MDIIVLSALGIIAFLLFAIISYLFSHKKEVQKVKTEFGDFEIIKDTIIKKEDSYYLALSFLNMKTSVLISCDKSFENIRKLYEPKIQMAILNFKYPARISYEFIKQNLGMGLTKQRISKFEQILNEEKEKPNPDKNKINEYEKKISDYKKELDKLSKQYSICFLVYSYGSKKYNLADKNHYYAEKLKNDLHSITNGDVIKISNKNNLIDCLEIFRRDICSEL